MDIKENKNYNENKNLLKEILRNKGLKNKVDSIICFFEYNPKNNQCIARKLNNKDISKFKDFIKKIIKPYSNNTISAPKKNLENLSIGNNLTTSEIGIKYLHIEYEGKDFYFIYGGKERINIRKKIEKDSNKEQVR
ncbi:MAG: hypothetical protein KH846_02805 [Leptotrichia wadei]|uniref:hypothetical protein n=1 Tax=Leptotrichia wadei TaxID=157687 RepID=UPI0026E9E78F|nr:hypothetical protein [Leptotrichia wadei]MBS6019120.1 hypothetical protein [Leptotrichia wadei]